MSLPEDIQKLSVTIEELTRVQREMLQVAQRVTGAGPGGNGAGGGQGPSAQFGGPTGSTPATAPWQAPKADSALGMSLSATRGLLGAVSAPGMGQGGNAVSSLMGGLASGGPAGLLGAAVGLGVNEFASRQASDVGMFRAGLSGVANAPASDTFEMARRRGSSNVERAMVDEEERRAHSIFMMSANDFTDEGKKRMMMADLGRAERKLEISRREEDAIGPASRATAETESRFERFARAGGFREGPGFDHARKMFEEVRNIFLHQQQGIQDMHKVARMKHESLNPASPGAQSGRQY